MKTENQIVLADGRRLAYAEFDDANGHGTASEGVAAVRPMRHLRKGGTSVDAVQPIH